MTNPQIACAIMALISITALGGWFISARDNRRMKRGVRRGR